MHAFPYCMCDVRVSNAFMAHSPHDSLETEQIKRVEWNDDDQQVSRNVIIIYVCVLVLCVPQTNRI